MEKTISIDAVKVWRKFYSLVYTVIYIIILLTIGISFFLNWSIVIIHLVLLISFLLITSHIGEIIWLIPARQKYYKYQFNDTYIKISQGRIFKNALTVPLTKVYFVNIKSDPFVRRFDMCNLEFGTLGEQHRMSCLKIADAELLKAHIIKFSHLENPVKENTHGTSQE